MLKVSGIGSTMMACLETGVMEQEQAYLAALGQSATFQAQADSTADRQRQRQDHPGLFSASTPAPDRDALGAHCLQQRKTGSRIAAGGNEDHCFFAADNSLTGSAGCNTYTASYKVNGDQIHIGSAASTMMFCSQPDGVMDQETAYLKALESANTYEISGDQLTLRTADGATAASYHAVQPTPLVGTQWQLTAYNNGKGGVVSTVSGSQVTALFSEDGKLTGSAGCNTYTAAYKATGDKIQISQAASTLMMCAEPQGVMEQETAYLQAIGKAATYQIEGDQLTLRGPMERLWPPTRLP